MIIQILLACAAIAQADTMAQAPASVAPPVSHPWQKTIDASLMTTQNAYSNSWSGGEAGSFTWSANFSGTAQKQLSGKMLFKQTAKVSFGQTLSQNESTKRWNPPAKSTDLIDLESLLRMTLGLVVDPFASLRVESQFRDARDPGNIRSFNPATFTGSFGAARTILSGKDRELNVRLGISAKDLVNRDEAVLDALMQPTTGRRTITEKNGGMEFISDYKTPVFSDKVRYTSRLGIYKAFYNSKADALANLPNGNYWKAPDVSWENTLTASISKYLMVNLYMQWLYDKEVDVRGRLKETLSLGLTYSMK